MWRYPFECDLISDRVLVVNHRLQISRRHDKKKDIPHVRTCRGTRLENRRATVKRLKNTKAAAVLLSAGLPRTSGSERIEPCGYSLKSFRL